ncbi:hypothetical protein [Actinoplanes xinjiangensis]|nr:hypothetical protein [Actinoplanes xinjiangensis]GIF45258.1 hypothetical protein Axi01nite_95690 [Actinoplanes xinjiangensis]
MALILRDVFLPSTVVEGDEFSAEVGGTVSMALELYCHYWTAASDRDLPGWAAVHPGTYRHADSRSVHELVGVAVPTEHVWSTGWTLDAAGLLLYVDQAPGSNDLEAAVSKVHRDPASQTGIPALGSAVRVKGRLSIAEDYVTSGSVPETTLLQRAIRPWSVRRMTLLERDGRHSDVPATGRWGANGIGYLLDLAETPLG